MLGNVPDMSFEFSPKELANVRYAITQMMEADIPEVVSLEESTGLSRWGFDSYRYELFENPLSVMRTARAIEPITIKNRVLGFIASRVIVDELHVNNIATHPCFRRMQIAAKLLQTAIRESYAYGARRCILEVRASNLPAQGLYAKFGFQIIGRRKAYYSFPTEDALVMQALY